MSPLRDRTDEELVRASRSSGQEAFHALCDRHTGRLLGFLRRHMSGALRTKVGASDILQEAYLVAYRRLAEFEDRGEGSFGRWLLQIVALKLREARRHYAGTAKRGLGREVPAGDGKEAEALPSPVPSPSQAAMASELAETARKALERLPEDYREVLRLVQEQQLPVKEAAARMGRSSEALQKLYERALARFAELAGIGRQTHGHNGPPR